MKLEKLVEVTIEKNYFPQKFLIFNPENSKKC
jgi:hypothetical protein